MQKKIKRYYDDVPVGPGVTFCLSCQTGCRLWWWWAGAWIRPCGWRFDPLSPCPVRPTFSQFSLNILFSYLPCHILPCLQGSIYYRRSAATRFNGGVVALVGELRQPWHVPPPQGSTRSHFYTGLLFSTYFSLAMKRTMLMDTEKPYESI